jgi:ABC-type bacteriocin/lantibiotic exporter with double-glycine peptidase domain
MGNFKKLFFLLSPRERKQSAFLIIIILIGALLDMIGVASILPFIAVLTNSSLIETNFIVNLLFEKSKILGVKNYNQFVFFLGIFFLISFIVSLIFKTLVLYAQVRFTEMRYFSISKRFVESYLQQPYSWFLTQNSSELGKTILSEINIVVANGYTQILEIITKGSISVALITLLILVDAKIAIASALTIVVIYMLIFFSFSKFVKKIGKERLLHNELRFKLVDEVFKAVKEVKIGGLEQNYINLFSRSAFIYAKTTVSAEIIRQLPRFFLEAIVFGGILAMILYLMLKTGDFNSALPILSLYVLAGYRLMPALQQTYASITLLKFVGPSLNKLYEDVKNLKFFEKNQNHSVLSFNKAINLKNICYNYPNSSRKVINGINLNISARSSVGFIGKTGSGKTTIVDIILGLLQPQKGTLQVDGKVITKKNLKSWQRLIGYVPQNIHLFDGTVAANIAIGTKDINQNLIEKVARIANLHQFVMKELPNQYQTIIGENGIRLSGGERQRIGIARALYHQPQVLVLDEATSALDDQTEKKVIDSINNLDQNITIIFIAHRLNTIKNCDVVFKLAKGKIISIN